MRELGIFVAVALILVISAISYAYVVLFLAIMGIMLFIIAGAIGIGNGVKWVFTIGKLHRFQR